VLNPCAAARTGSRLTSVCTLSPRSCPCQALLAPSAAGSSHTAGLSCVPGAPRPAPHSAEHGTAPAPTHTGPGHSSEPASPQPRGAALCPHGAPSPPPHATSARTTNQTQSRALGNRLVFPTVSRRAVSSPHHLPGQLPCRTRLLAAPHAAPRVRGGPARSPAPRHRSGDSPGAAMRTQQGSCAHPTGSGRAQPAAPASRALLGAAPSPCPLCPGSVHQPLHSPATAVHF